MIKSKNSIKTHETARTRLSKERPHPPPPPKKNRKINKKSPPSLTLNNLYAMRTCVALNVLMGSDLK